MATLIISAITGVECGDVAMTGKLLLCGACTCYWQVEKAAGSPSVSGLKTVPDSGMKRTG